MRKFNQFVAALAFGASLAVSATAAQATTVILDKGMMDHARTVNISGIGNVYAAPMQFDAVYGGQSVDLLAWCVDVYHTISAKDYAPDLQYVDTSTLSTDFNGKALDSGDVLKIGLLANYGQGVFDDVPVPPPAFTQAEPKRNQFPNGSAGTTAYNNAKAAYNAAKAAYNTALAAYNTAVSTRYTRLQAVQGAIWQVASNRNVSSSDSSFDLLVDNLSSANLTDFFVGGYGDGDYGFTLITPVQQYGGWNGKTPLALTQSFVFATGAVPEPTTWALLIAGFGGAGAMLRRQRRLASVA
ncbi:PEPxxWA-CTERM sorting domain-containing protein [Phenylobacterium sp.]|uniref:PEPxxWA-CTERM sorting domain-containing protein n=1 Tax=Phenylobacterium sp. TaxID=1871053 RepID=UPI0025EA5B24|nr:PEPxxWA-CTERM sorting domain-containing protein [Phenylobacterium sp.]